MNSENILEIKNLSVSFGAGTTQAVRGVDLAVRKASFTSMVGESGSGKTVTALSVKRLVLNAKVSGGIHFDSKASYIFQDPFSSFNPLMRLGDQMTEVVHDSPKALALLSRVKILDAERVFRSYPHEVSGGQRQRVAIAMALMTDPDLLIADEPTTALDAVTQHEIMELLAALQKEMRLSILFITHDLVLAEKYSDVIYVMQKGVVVEKLMKENNRFIFKSDYAKALFDV